MDRNIKAAEEIMKRGDDIIAENKRRRAIITRTACSASLSCAALAICFGVFHNGGLKNAPDEEKFTHIVNVTEAVTDDVNTKNEMDSGTSDVPQTDAPSEGETKGVGEVRMAMDVTEENVHNKQNDKPNKEQDSDGNTRYSSPAAETVTGVPDDSANAVEPTDHAEENDPCSAPTGTSNGKPVSGSGIGSDDPDEYPTVPQLPKCRCSVVAGNIYYSSKEEFTIPEDAVGEKLWDAAATLVYQNGYKGKNETVITEAEVFCIMDIGTELAVAVRYDGEEEFYCYTAYYRPASVGQLIDDCGFTSHMRIISAEYIDSNDSTRNRTYGGFDGSAVVNVLSRYMDKPSVSYDVNDVKCLKIEFMIPEVSDKIWTLGITDSVRCNLFVESPLFTAKFKLEKGAFKDIIQFFDDNYLVE